jgi:hypothetical protein
MHDDHIGVPQTLESVVRTQAPGLVFVIDHPSTATTAATSGTPTPTTAVTAASSVSTATTGSGVVPGSRREDVDVLVQGMSPSMNTPLLYLCDNCSHPDGFLYINIVRARPHHDD